VKMTRRWRNIGILIVLLIGAYCVQRAMFRPRPIEVDVQAAAVGVVEDVVTNSEAGTVKTRSRAKLGVETYGRVGEIPHREGARVKQGEILLRLDTATERTRLEASRRELDAQTAGLGAAQSAATLARQNFDRVDQLRAKGIASQENLDEARARLTSADAEAQVAAARAKSARTAVRLADDALTHVEIRAPFDGTVAHRFVEVGEQVAPGQALLELVSLSQLYVSAPIDERDAGRLVEGLPVRITVDTYPNAVWNSRITRLSPVVEEAKEQNRTVDVEADFPAQSGNPTPSPGMTADVEIVLDRRDRVLRVPSFSVVDGKRVLVAQGRRAVSRDVELGLRNWEWAEVRSGLAAGDRVITSLDRQGLKAGVAISAKERSSDGARSP